MGTCLALAYPSMHGYGALRLPGVTWLPSRRPRRLVPSCWEPTGDTQIPSLVNPWPNLLLLRTALMPACTNRVLAMYTRFPGPALPCADAPRQQRLPAQMALPRKSLCRRGDANNTHRVSSSNDRQIRKTNLNSITLTYTSGPLRHESCALLPIS